MPRNGAGQYSAPIGTLGVSGTIISSSAYDGFVGDLSTEITNSLNVQGTAPMLAPLNMGGNLLENLAPPTSANPNAAVTYTQLQAILPSGAVFWFAAPTPPAGFLECNGVSLSTTTFATLFAVIGYTHGGSGANFNIPDLRGMFIRGWDHGRGLDTNTPSRAFGSFEDNANQTHDHIISQAPHAHGISDPGHNHSQSPHAHLISDPGHNHAQSGHSHGVNDPTHAHSISNGTIGVGVNLAAGSGFNMNTGSSTNAAATGISIQAADANIAAAFTGIAGTTAITANINAAATGIGIIPINANVVNLAQGSSEATVRNIALLPCIKT